MPRDRHQSQVPLAFRQARVFAGLSASDLADVAGHFKARAFDRDACLVMEGDPASTYYLVAGGRVKIVQTSAEGHEVILHLLGEGELIGALPALGDGTYPASAIALDAVSAFAVTAGDFDLLLDRYAAIARNLLRFAARQLQASHRRLREMATERVERRIARTLSRLAAQLGKRDRQGIVLDAPLSRQDLAELTGTTLFTVSRTLKAWERQGILISHREQVIIADPHALVAIGEDLPAPAESA